MRRAVVGRRSSFTSDTVNGGSGIFCPDMSLDVSSTQPRQADKGITTIGGKCLLVCLQQLMFRRTTDLLVFRDVAFQ